MKAFIRIDRDFIIGETDRRLVSSHVEHAGRGVYNGIYEPEHSTSDENGFRKDVIDLVREMKIASVRYPGGNFVSGYRWEDGVGPKEKRPIRPERAWTAIESNAFGVNEFMDWANKAEVSPMLSVNLGTRGLEEACDFLEYCNFEKGTYFSDMRRSHGIEKPYGVKTWFLGNEMDGPWQLGHLPGGEYGRKAAGTAFAMRSLQPDLELILSGSSGREFRSFPNYLVDALSESYDLVDLVSIHQYYGGQYGWTEYGTPDFLGVSLDLDAFLHETKAACDFVKARTGSKKVMNISLDEWCIWPDIPYESLRLNEAKPWAPEGGPLAEGSITFEQFMVGCLYVMTVLKHADRVKILCANLLVNTCGPIHTEIGGPAWRQPSFYIVKSLAEYGMGQVLQTVVQSPKYDGKRFTDVPYVDAICVRNANKKELTLFCANRSLDEAADVELHCGGFEGLQVLEHIEFSCDDICAVNGPDKENVFPKYIVGRTEIDRNMVKSHVKAFSWNIIRFKYE